MSTLIVKVREINRVEVHPNADRLEIAHMDGWQSVVKKDQFKPGDRVVYLPPDSVVNQTLADQLGITKYCSQIKDQDRFRIRATRLRGVSSFGTIFPTELPVDTDCIELFNVEKWEPPVKSHDGDAAPEWPTFHRYTDMENFRNFPDLFDEGQPVVITEKLHGRSWRAGYCQNREGLWDYCVGSHNVNRKQFSLDGKESVYWTLLTEPIKEMLEYLHDVTKNVIVFSEMIGPSMQDMRYGQDQIALRVFDIAINGRYMDWTDAVNACHSFDVPVVPVLYSGPFSKEKLLELTDGPTTMCDPKQAGAFKGREGVVVKPLQERIGRTGHRLILKSVSADYLDRRDATDGH